jgi:hypothetical protein
MLNQVYRAALISAIVEPVLTRILRLRFMPLKCQMFKFHPTLTHLFGFTVPPFFPSGFSLSASRRLEFVAPLQAKPTLTDDRHKNLPRAAASIGAK